MLILGLETATDTCSVALLDDARCVVDLSLHRARVHSERLPLLIREALDHADVPPGDLDAVAVSRGPGSYTGLRIGVSTAKGLAEAAGAAFVGVPSLEALAAHMARWAGGGRVLVPVFTSRRGEVYVAAFRVEGSEPLTTLRAAEALELDAASDWLADVRTGSAADDTCWLGGPGAADFASALSASSKHTARQIDVAPSGASVAEVGLRRLQAGREDDPASFEPHYLKDFVLG